MEPTRTAPPAPCRRRGTALARSLAVLGLVLLPLIALAPGALASEFVPVPDIAYDAHCTTGNQLAVSFTLTNKGLGIATFVVTRTIDGVTAPTDTFDVGPVPATPGYLVQAGQAATFSVVSTDGAGATFSRTFAPVDCAPLPAAEITLVCGTPAAPETLIRYHYWNPSSLNAQFVFTDPSGPDYHAYNIFGVEEADEAVINRFVAEGTHVQATAVAEGQTVASLDTIVDCIPPTHHVTVSKTVLGGTGDPGFSFEVACHQSGPAATVASFTLHDGESQVVDLPAASVCSAHEVDPGPGWTAVQSLDGAVAVPTPPDQEFSSDEDHTLEVTNTAVPDHTLTVTNAVDGGPAGASFAYAVDCQEQGGPDVVTTFALTDGQSVQLSLLGTTSCVVTESDPGTGWSTSHSVDGGPVVDNRTDTVVNDGDHLVAFTNSLAPPETTSTTETPTTSTPGPVPPETAPTEPDGPHRAPATPADEVVLSPLGTGARRSAPAPSVTTGALARTGSDTAAPLVTGLLLLALGVVVAAAARRVHGAR